MIKTHEKKHLKKVFKTLLGRRIKGVLCTSERGRITRIFFQLDNGKCEVFAFNENSLGITSFDKGHILRQYELSKNGQDYEDAVMVRRIKNKLIREYD